MTKNIGKSIKTRLLNLARDEKQEYMKVLVRYLHERLLYRISVSTFKNRKTTYHDGLKLFTDDFATNPTRNIWWKAFLKKIRWKEQIEFPAVMECMRDNLQGYWNAETLSSD